MANLPESPEWEGVYQIEKADAVLGGIDGAANKPLINLTNRTAYLKKQLENVSSVFDLLFPVGHMLITRNKNNPADYGYPGTWRREPDDFSLISTTDNSKLGAIEGENDPLVPVPSHSHTASASSFDYGVKRSNTTGNHGHSGSTNQTGNHKHETPVLPANGQNPEYPWGHNSRTLNGKHEQGSNHNRYAGWTSDGGAHTHTLSINAAGDHYHDTSIGAHSHSVTVNGTGTEGATLNVRGRHMKVAVWTRIS